MEKFSFFDLLSFAIPGSASMLFIYWAALNCSFIHLPALQVPDSLLIAALLMLAYFMGHVVSELGSKIESRLGGLPKTWVEILEKNPVLAQNLNSISVNLFGINFVLDDGKIDIAQSDMFYDNAFNVLEVNGKLEKIRILQSQYVFFKNASAVSLIGFLSFLLVLICQLSKTGQFGDDLIVFSGIGLLLCLIVIFKSRSISIKRRRFKMHATLNEFYAFYISETKLKK